MTEPVAETNIEPLSSNIEENIVPPKGSYVKYAMRNMVRKGGTSFKHFFITTIALLGTLVVLAYLTR
jgi:hypothetical protein